MKIDPILSSIIDTADAANAAAMAAASQGGMY
jgi:IMP dehydrogenase/GMP reductase